MLSRRKVFIRILALLQMKTLIETKNKSFIKMLKTALFDYVINEKCCSVDRGRGIWQLKSPRHREFAIQGKKNANGWSQLELTDA